MKPKIYHGQLGKIAYYDNGLSGPAVVFIHGWTSYPVEFSWLTQLLPNTRIICPFLPGSGESSPLRQWHFGQLAQVLADFISGLELSDYILAGHSMGGMSALAIFPKLKTKPRHLVIAGSPLAPIKNRWKVIGDVLREIKARKSLGKTIGNQFHFRYLFKGFNLAETYSVDWEYLRRRKAFIYFLWGKDDFFVPLKDNIEIIKAYPLSELKVFPGNHVFHYGLSNMSRLLPYLSGS